MNVEDSSFRLGAGSLRLLILAGSEFRAGKWAAANSAPGLVSKCRFSVGIFWIEGSKLQSQESLKPSEGLSFLNEGCYQTLNLEMHACNPQP